MGWEKRRKREFYYRSRRVRGQVVKQYVGGGELGRQAAEADQSARDSYRQAAVLRKEANRAVVDLAGHLDEFDELVDQLVTFQLIGAGFRLHHRQWRPPTNGHRRRDRNA